MSRRISYSASSSPSKEIVRPFTSMNFSPLPSLDSHFEAIDDIYQQELQTFHNENGLKERKREVYSSMSYPHSAKRTPRSPTEFSPSSDFPLKHLRRKSNPDEYTKTAINTPIRPYSQQSDYCSMAKECLIKLRGKHKSFDNNNRHKISPRKQKLIQASIDYNRNLKCSMATNLMEACKNFPNSEEINTKIDKEKKYMNSWSKFIDSTSEILQNIDYCDNVVLKHLFYFNKNAIQDMYQDSQIIKQGTKHKPFRLKSKANRKHNLATAL
ncbi:unnamed protein product [Blepharisma stoltei]|uniref:Uncharacterized protein n=1 Tax=Blepharisma stoltei TaxID=1481888 RepID=A0AAU9IG05_9CILI|nr:unnamed protein product [Blepharisma stoltei]